jgi:uncharacterized protein
MELHPEFPLFPDPVRERVIERSERKCSICEHQRGSIYTGPQYGQSPATDDLTVCPWCIADGSAGGRGLHFNDPTIYPAFDSTPQLTADDRTLVARKTPGFVTWQGNHWLMCCGRACLYLGEADPADLRGRWSSAIPSMFAGEDRDAAEIEEIVSEVTRGGVLCAYVFQCQVCRGLRAYWDCH